MASLPDLATWHHFSPPPRPPPICSPFSALSLYMFASFNESLHSQNLPAYWFYWKAIRFFFGRMESLTLTGFLRLVAGEFSSRRALSVSGKFDLTYARLQQLVEGAASRLFAAGVNAGDVVALTFPNTVEVCFICLSCLVSKKILEFCLCFVLFGRSENNGEKMNSFFSLIKKTKTKKKSCSSILTWHS